MRKSRKQGNELTRQLLTFAQGGEPMKKLINPASLIRETVSFALRGSDIRSNIDIQDNLWSMEVDESQLNQVLNNLLLNAGSGHAWVVEKLQSGLRTKHCFTTICTSYRRAITSGLPWRTAATE